MRHITNSLLTVLTLFLLALTSLTPALAERLVSAISSSSVAITSNFSGAQILVYGEIARDAESVPRSGDQDLVIVVEGPLERVTTWRKDRILGVWINATSQTYIAVPSFYAVHTTDDLRNIASENWLKQYRIGLDNLPLAALGSRAPPLNVSPSRKRSCAPASGRPLFAGLTIHQFPEPHTVFNHSRPASQHPHRRIQDHNLPL